MAKTVYKLTKDEQKLYRELEKDVKKANTRIRRLFTLGIKEPFAYKQLHSYLGAKTINGMTKSGYISLRKGYNLQQLQALKRATTDFLDDVSTIRKIEKTRKEYSLLLGKDISTRQANTIYQIIDNYEWIYEYIPKSEFWSVYAPLTKILDQKSWVEQLYLRNEKIADEDLRKELKALYIYCKKE